ncbi:hypothetical protein [Phyllobacterium chamaecytisi]|uniref:hypothetical protein n=1 Tax=Phyllobacterium chamaecytisi TaxID=2876082 RepID=UPI001CC952DC|nr:hypothetical protein [Phyllobacterium sp. KW56]MBZ9603100.1 hypothetical protein [Phyllobacterium sp. KW56]
MPDKEGLVTAIEFTKFVLTLDGALIAFLTGTSFLAQIDPGWERTALIVALILLGSSLAAGVLVYMRGATMLSDQNYDLADRGLKIPGMINVIGFASGAVAVAVLAIVALVFQPPEAAKSNPLPLVCIMCRM